MKVKGESILVTALGKAELQRIVQTLNSSAEPELRERLRSLVLAWWHTGPNLQVLQEEGRTQEGLHLGQILQDVVRLVYMPQKSGRALVRLEFDLGFGKTARLFHRRDPKQAQAELRAIQLFAELTLNPSWNDLGGPCTRAGCGRYFVKRRRAQKYCSRRCHSLDTAEAKWTRDREAKLKKARAALRRWPGVRVKKDWKVWVARQTQLNAKFLTRAVNKGELVAPKEKGRHHA